VQELMAGTLSGLLHLTQRRLPLAMVLHLALDVARGLQYLHALSVVHRGEGGGAVDVSGGEGEGRREREVRQEWVEVARERKLVLSLSSFPLSHTLHLSSACSPLPPPRPQACQHPPRFAPQCQDCRLWPGQVQAKDLPGDSQRRGHGRVHVRSRVAWRGREGTL
jgi:hypothetical protein